MRQDVNVDISDAGGKELLTGLTQTGDEDDKVEEMVRESQKKKSSIQVSFESGAARINDNQTLTFNLSDGATSRGWCRG